MKIYKPLYINAVLPGMIGKENSNIIVTELSVATVVEAICGNTIAMTNRIYTVIYDLLDCKDIVGCNPETIVDLIFTPDGVTIKRHDERKTDDVHMSNDIIKELEESRKRRRIQLYEKLMNSCSELDVEEYLNL